MLVVIVLPCMQDLRGRSRASSRSSYRSASRGFEVGGNLEEAAKEEKDAAAARARVLRDGAANMASYAMALEAHVLGVQM